MTSATTPVRGGTVAAILGSRPGAGPSRSGGCSDGHGRRDPLGSFGSFVGLWVPMMAAMMLPGAIPAVLRVAHGGTRVGRAATFLGSYTVVWSLVGVVVYALHRPHGTHVAGGVALAAGVSELTPVKRHWRQRCRESVESGFGFGA